MGPAADEQRLEAWLEGLILRFPASPPREEGLASPELSRAIDLASTLWMEGEIDWSSIPNDPGLLRLVARRLPVVTPPHLLEAIEKSLGRTSALDLALLEWVAKAPVGKAAATLTRLEEQAQEGDRTAAFQAQCLFLVGAVARRPEDLRMLRLRCRSRNLLISHFARRGFAAQQQEWFRRATPEAAARELGSIALRSRPFEADRLQMDAVQLFLWQVPPPSAGLNALLAVKEATGHALSTHSMNAHADAELAHFWFELLGGAPNERLQAILDESVLLSRSPLAEEDSLHVQRLRERLARGFLMQSGAGSPRELFVETLEHCVLDQNQCLIDQAFFGSFGPQSISLPLRRAGRSETLISTLENLVQVIEETSAHTGYGSLSADPERDECVQSWIFLHLADLLLRDRADPSGALLLLEARAEQLEKRERWENLELLVETRSLIAQVYTQLRQWEPARRNFESALALLDDLDGEWRDSWLEAWDRGQPEPPPSTAVLDRDELPGDERRARILLARASASFSLTLDAPAAAGDVLQAGRLMQWSGDRWLACGLDLARRGHRSHASRALAHVEPFSDRLYNVAATEAWLGQGDAAVDHLRLFLDGQYFTDAGRKQLVEWMNQDADLTSIRSHPRFPR